MHSNNDYRITAANNTTGSANDEGLQSSYPGSGAHGDPTGFSNLSQLLDLTQSLHARNMQHNATSVSPSSTYYGSASPATIFSPPVKTPMDNTNATTNYHAQNPNEAAFPLFAPVVAPNHHHPHQTHNPNVHPGAGVTRFPEFKLPNYNVPADFFNFPPQQPQQQQQPPPHPIVVAAPNSVQQASAAGNASGIVPAPSTGTATSQDNYTINELTAICPPQDAEDLREKHAHFANEPPLQQLHLRLMWKWYTERERPSNDDLLKFHRAHRRSAGHAATKGTGSRGGAEGYTCLWPGCTKQDQPSRSDRAQEHTLLHLGLKPFGCKACGAEFTRHNELKRHDKTCKNKKASIHTHNLSADDITLPFIVREPVPSSSRRTSFPSTPSSSSRPNAANKKARRAVRGVSSDPSSGGNSPTSPLNSSSSSRPPHSLFTSLTVDSHEQPSHHAFFDSLPTNNTNNSTTTNNNNNGNGNPGFNGAQFQPQFRYPFAISPHGAPLPLPIPGTTTLPLSSSSPSGYGPNAASTSSSPPRAPYVSMPPPLPYPYGPQPQQGYGHPRTPFSFHHLPLHNQEPSSSPFSPPLPPPSSDNLDPRSPYPGQSRLRRQ